MNAFGNPSFIPPCNTLVEKASGITKSPVPNSNVRFSETQVNELRFSETQVNEFFKNYLNQFVLCHECKKPDTHFEDMKGVKMLKCEACGAVSPTKGV